MLSLGEREAGLLSIRVSQRLFLATSKNSGEKMLWSIANSVISTCSLWARDSDFLGTVKFAIIHPTPSPTLLRWSQLELLEVKYILSSKSLLSCL
jgi:hypothetical protein